MDAMEALKFAEDVLGGKKNLREIFSLEKHEQEMVVFALKDRVSFDKLEFVKRAAPRYFAVMLKPEPEKFSAVAAKLQGDEWEQEFAINALLKYPQQGLKLIVKLLASPSEFIRETTRNALKKVGFRIVPPLAKLAKTLKNDTVFKGVVEVIASFGRPSFDWLVDLAGFVEDSKLLYWCVAAFKDQEFEKEVVDRLAELMEKVEDYVKDRIVDVLSQWKNDYVYGKVWEGIKSDKNLRWWLRLEGRLTAEAKNLLEYLKMDDDKLKWEALSAIDSDIAVRPDVLKILVDMYVNGGAFGIKANEILEDASVKLGDKLFELYMDPRDVVKKLALRLLKMQGRGMIDKVVFLLEKGDAQQRYMAAQIVEALGLQRDDVREALQNNLSFGDEWVRKQCAQALVVLFGKEMESVLPEDLKEFVADKLSAFMSVEEIMEMLREPNSRNKAFEMLVAKGKEALPVITERYKVEEDEEVRYWLLKAKRTIEGGKMLGG